MKTLLRKAKSQNSPRGFITDAQDAEETEDICANSTFAEFVSVSWHKKAKSRESLNHHGNYNILNL
jgi:hypothetical protein